MNIPAILGKITGSAAGTLVKDLGETIGKFNLSKEEKLEFELKLKEATDKHEQFILGQSHEIEKAYLADTQNARASNVSIQDSEKASWMAKNFAYYMDAFFVMLFGIMLFVIMKHEVPAKNVELFYTAFGSLGAYVATVVNFHRGTSQGSHTKQKQLDKLANK